MLEHQDYIINNAKNGKNVDTIYLDFAKAFDKVDHGVLLHKVRALGIQKKIGVWIHSFLSIRTQAIAIDGAKSQHSSVLSGVPQGSVLGPSLFLIMLGDINKDVKNSRLSSFADETRISKVIIDHQDAQDLQADLNKVTKWISDNNMAFNEYKFELLRYRNNTHLETTQYLVGNQKIDEKTSVRDLGVQVSNDFQFAAHFDNITRTAR